MVFYNVFGFKDTLFTAAVTPFRSQHSRRRVFVFFVLFLKSFCNSALFVVCAKKNKKFKKNHDTIFPNENTGIL